MRQTEEVSPRVLATVLCVFLAALVVSSLYAARLAEIHRTERKLFMLREQIARYVSYTAEVGELRKAIARANEEYAEVSALDAENVPFWVLLSRTSRLIDESTWLDRLSISPGGSVSLSGSALSYASVSNTLGNISQDPLFKNVQLRTAYVLQLASEPELYGIGFEIEAFINRGVDLNGVEGQ